MTDVQTATAPAEARRASRRGMLVCLAMFALGGAVLWGLFQVPRHGSPVAPAVPWSAPARPLRFLSVDLGGKGGAGDELVKRIRAVDPDYVLVQNVRFDDVLPLAEALGMARSFHPQLFQRPDPRAKDLPGDVILSIHPLYEAKAVVLDADPSQIEARGVRAVSVVDRGRFVVVCGVGATDASRKALEAGLRREGSPPTVLATGIIRPTSGEGVYSGYLLQALVARQNLRREVVPVGGIYADAAWVQGNGDLPRGADGKHLLIYVELKGSGAAPGGGAGK